MSTSLKLKTAIVFISLVFSLSLIAQVQTPRYTSMTPNTGGFYEYLPQGYNPNGATTYPLLIFIHGIGELGNGGPAELPRVLYNGPPKLINQGIFPQSFTVNGQTHKFIVISPQYMGWPSTLDVNNTITYCMQNYKVDPSRIYLTGLSMGGGAVWEYAGNNAQYANRVAAIVTACGASWPEYGRARTIAASNLPVWATHNSGDGTVPVSYTNDYVSQINEAPAPNPQARKTIFQVGGHDAWSTTYDPNYKENNLNVYEWMLQYQRGNGANQPPVAVPGTDIIISLPTNSTPLSGANSWDPDGIISSYSWTKISGPAQYNISNANIVNPVISNLVEGSYVFRLTVTDNQGATASANINIRLNGVQQIPGKIEAENYSAMYGIQTENTSDAGGGLNVGYVDGGDWMDYSTNVAAAGNYTVNLRVAALNSGGQLQIKKSDGTILTTLNIPVTYSWQNWTTVTTSFNLSAGNQTLRVLCSGSVGWNINWMEFISANPTPNQPPVAKAGADQTITLPANSVTLNGSASTDDNAIVAYQWTKISGTGGTFVNANAATTTFNGLIAGTYIVELKVTDASNLMSTDTVQITVLPTVVNNGKTIPGRIEAEDFDAQFGIQTEGCTEGGLNVGWMDSGDWLDYNVNVTAAGTYLASVRVSSPQTGTQFQLKLGNTVLATFTNPNTYGFQNWTTISTAVTLPAGNQVLRLQSLTYGWNINWMEFISANPTPNQPPVAKVGADQTITLPINSVTLNGSASTDDNAIVAYQWTKISGTGGTFVNANAATTTFNGLIAGIYIVELKVTDAGNLTSKDTLQITVLPTVVNNGKTIPGRIEAEDFDAQFGIQTEGCTEGGLNVGWMDSGDWLDYNVNVTAAGTYLASFRVSSPQTGTQFQLKLGNTVLATFTNPNTYGFQNWTTISTAVTLPAGNQVLRVQSLTYGWNINWMEFNLTGNTNQPPVAKAGPDQTITLPANSVTLNGSASTDDHAIVAYQWTKISGTGGTFVNANAATTTFNGLIAGTYIVELKVTDASNLMSTDTVQITVLPTVVNNGKTIPGRIESEDFNAQFGIQTEGCTEGGLNVGWMDYGDWLDYNVNVTAAGTYLASFRVSSPQTGAQFQLKLGNTILGTFTVPTTNGFQNWVTISAPVTLSAGNQVLRVQSLSYGWNINWMEFSTAIPTITSINLSEGKNAPSSLSSNDAIDKLIKIYPNPANDHFTLQLSENIVGDLNVEIISMNGAISKKINLKKNKGVRLVNVSVQDLKPGVYLINIKTAEWEKSLQLIKQ